MGSFLCLSLEKIHASSLDVFVRSMSLLTSVSQDSSWNPVSVSLVATTCTVFLVFSYHVIFKRSLEALPVQTRNGLSAPSWLLEDPDPSSQQFRIGRLRSSLLKTLPVAQYANEGEVKAAECVVSVGEFSEGERTRNLPNCGDRFHVACIDAWFRDHSSCPICRARVGPGTTTPETLSGEDFVLERAMSYQDLRKTCPQILNCFLK